MNAAQIGDFFYSLKAWPIEQQEAAVEAKLADDPTIRQTLAFDLWRVYTGSKIGSESNDN